MKHLVMASAAAVLAGLFVAPPAFTQQLPQGSYTQSCREIRVQAGTLLAICREADGRWDTLALAQVGSCIGDIGNVNGALTCERGPAFGSSRIQVPRDELLRLSCNGLIDPIARERCLRRF
jgi:hypothetical protein